MSDLLESLRTQSPLPPWAPPPVPLPVGPYPTAVWPAGIAAIKQAAVINAAVADLQRQAAAVNARHVFTLRPTVLPKPEKIVSVTLEGATHTVALDSDGEPNGDYWIDSVLIGGKWHSAADTFADAFIVALEKQVAEDFAYEAAAQAEGPL